MNTDQKQIGWLPYFLIIILTALAFRYVSIAIGVSLCICLHVAFLLFKNERVPITAWLFLSLSLLIPIILVAVSSPESQFYKVFGKGPMFGFFPKLDIMYLPYGGFTCSFLCLGTIYQNTSFYNIGFGKGGTGFYITSGLGILLAILAYYQVITRS